MFLILPPRSVPLGVVSPSISILPQTVKDSPAQNDCQLDYEYGGIPTLFAGYSARNASAPSWTHQLLSTPPGPIHDTRTPATRFDPGLLSRTGALWAPFFLFPVAVFSCLFCPGAKSRILRVHPGQHPLPIRHSSFALRPREIFRRWFFLAASVQVLWEMVPYLSDILSKDRFLRI